MTLFVPVPHGDDPEITEPLGIEVGATYTLTAADGITAVFNDPTSSAFVGYLTDISGLDSAEIRENADLLTAADGAVHGPFYLGRRPITISGVIAASGAEDRNLAITRLQRAANALRADATLQWQTTSGMPVELRLRQSEPVRITGLQPKQFMLGLVAADPRVYATESTASSMAGAAAATKKQYPSLKPNPRVTDPWDAQLIIQTKGSSGTPASYQIRGPLQRQSSTLGWQIYNATTNTLIESAPDTAANIAAGATVTINTDDATVTHSTEGNWYGLLNFTATEFTPLAAGTNDLRFFGTATTSTTGYLAEWNDAWL